MASDIGLKIDNRYEVLGELGRGGMGVVYKANDLKMDRIVAIKLMTAHVAGKGEYRERFLREARSVAKMQHPNIVVVYDYGEYGGAPYMAMEYVEGTPLDRIIASGMNLSLIVKLDYVIQVCHALHYAHQFGIIHRDVKPANVVLLEGGQRVKLLDFGIARAGGASSLSKSGMAMGTTYYMSPQQTKGQKDLDGRADIFSIGVVLYELLAGTVPWTGESDYEVMTKIINDPFPPLSDYLRDYPPALDVVLERALAKETDARYANADQMAAELAELQAPLKEEILHQARALFEGGDMLRAHELVSEILRVDTRHGEALELNGKLQQALQLEQKTEQIRQLRAGAEEALGQKRYQDALSTIEKAIALNTTNPELQKYRELIRNELKRKGDVHKKLDLAKRAQEINDLPSAQELVDKALELDPTDTQARMMKSVLARRIEDEEKQKRIRELAEEVQRRLAARRFSDMHEIIRDIETLDPSFAPLASMKKAAAEGQAQERRRREREALAGDVQQLLAGGDAQQALAAAEQGLAKFPGDPALTRLRGQAQAKRDAAERERAIQEQIGLAAQLRDSGRITEALQLAEAAVRRFGADSRLRVAYEQLHEAAERERVARGQEEVLAQAREAMRASRYDSAVRILSAARIDFPSSEQIAEALQVAREEAARQAAAAEKARQQKVAETLQSLLSGEPNPDAQVRLAEEALRRSPGNAAVEQILSQLRERQQQISSLIQRAQAFEAAESHAEAMQEWERVRQVYPEYPELEWRITRLADLAAKPTAPEPSAEVAPPQWASATVIMGSLKDFLDAAPAPPAAPKAPPAPKPAIPAASPVEEPTPKERPAARKAASAPPAPLAQAAAAPAPAPADSARIRQMPPAYDETRGVPPPVSQAEPAAVRKFEPTVEREPKEEERGREAPVGVPVRVPSVRPPVPAPAASSKKWIGLAAAAAVVVVAGGLYFALHKPAPVPSTATPAETETVPSPAPVAPVPVAPAPAMGTLSIAAKDDKGARIDGADVFVDNQLRNTPVKGGKATLSLPAGKHLVRVEKAGYEGAPAQSVEIAKNGEARVQFALKKAAESAAAPLPNPYLMVTSTPGATIKVDGKTVENIGPDGKFSFQVEPGEHRVELSLRGFKPFSTTVTAKAGEKRVPVNAGLTAIPPPVVEFSATPSNIQEGQSTVLRWETNATEVTIEGLGTVAATGSKQVTPRSKTDYTLIAKGEGGSTKKAITVEVAAAPIPKPSIGSFAPSGPSTIQKGDKARLTWSTENATDVSIQGIGKVGLQGSHEVSPSETTTYLLTASGRGGSVTSHPVKITVEAPRAAATPAPSVPNPAALKAKDVAAIKDIIERQLKGAYESMSMAELERVWPDMPKSARQDTANLFSAAKDIKVDLKCDPAVTGDTASARCAQTMHLVYGGKPTVVSAPVVYTLKRAGGAWRLQDSHR